MTSFQTEINTTTQTITQDPITNTKILPPIINQQVEPGKIIEGQMIPMTTSEFHTTEAGANITNFQGITNVTNLGEQTQIEGVLNPIYTKEVKETQVHDLGTVNLGTVDLGTTHLEGQGFGAGAGLGAGEGDGQGLGSGQIEGVLNPIYTKEIKETQVHDLGTVNLGTVDLGTVKVNQAIEEDAEIEAVLKPIYTKEVRKAILIYRSNRRNLLWKLFFKIKHLIIRSTLNQWNII